ncbi:transporter substrate-binding domain-containing protein [Streptomyces microflavus]|uniref:transporter substrate-binding domain-containing protein n=1 Tax=Streptomyces microflavus TaxID=1919 RepID=UPI0033A740F9
MHDEDQPTRRLYARRAAPDGDTSEANELAQWLRARVGGRSLRQLEGLFRNLPGPVPGPGRTQWNELLNGRKLIHPTLLDEVVRKLVPPREQRIHLEHGRALLRAAQDAARLAAGPSSAAPGMGRDGRADLNDALQGRRRVRATEQSIDGFIRVVLLMTTELSRECRDLREERDQALSRLREVEATANAKRAAENRKREAENQRLLDDVVERLAGSEQQLAEFEERLDLALRKKQEAEGLRAVASGQLTEGDPSPGPGPRGEGAGFLPAPRPPEYEYFLEIADAQLEIYIAELDAAREQITSSPVPGSNPPEARIIPGQVVSDPSAVTTDTTTAGSGDPARGPSADATASGSGARPATAAVPGNTGRTTRPGDAGAVGGTGGRAGRDRTGRRRALVGAVCLALLAGGGGLVYHYALDKGPPDYVLADSSTLADAEERGEIVIGVKRNQPGMGVTDDDGTSNARGFEVDLARFILEEAQFKGEIRFKEVVSENRETGLQNEDYDMILATYSMNDKRKEKVNFSVPYFRTGQALLMRRGEGRKVSVWEDGKWAEKRVDSITDLPDDTDSCTVKSTSLESMESSAYGRKFKIDPDGGVKTSYAECIPGLLGGERDYEVISTDAVILAGLAYDHREELVVLPFTFTSEAYGVGMRKDDPALEYLTCRAIRKSIEEGKWKEFYDDHLKEIMGNVEGNPPEKPDCEKLSRKHQQDARD